MKLDEAWPLMPAGSSTSMTNFLPLDGVLVPRSRLSSLNTINVPGNAVLGLAELTSSKFATSQTWYSGSTVHGLVTSNGSISRASFVSSFGLGVASLTAQGQWQYAQTYHSTLDANILLAVGRTSSDTILAIYQTGGSASGAPLYSYLTGAPKAIAVGAFDNYVIAFGTTSGGVIAPTRVQWCQRGNPSNWTGEGSGFEDLLEMRGQAEAVRAISGKRLMLFSNMEIWQGVGATYPAQFDFVSLDPQVGCPFPATIQATDAGLVFLGSDLNLRLLPKDGGPSQVVVPSLSPILRNGINTEATIDLSWAVYDRYTGIYHLYITAPTSSSFVGIAVNTRTGEWGYTDYQGLSGIGPRAGVCVDRTINQYVGNEGLMYGSSTGTVYSTHSKLATDSGSTVTATWRSAPIAADLPGSYKQLTKVCLDYRSTSASTVTLRISQDGGNTYEATGVAMSLVSAPVSGRKEQDVYNGGAFPAIELTSTSTGYELHRLDVSMNLGGRK